MRLREGLPPLPARIAKLPVDDRGYPVPWFVAWLDGKPEFRVADGYKQRLALRQRLCWVCGERLGANLAFVIGPMCAINRVSAEPPAHRECAEFSAVACPFLNQTEVKRRAMDLPEKARWSETGLKRQPGVVLVWITRNFTPIRGAGTEVLFRIGDPLLCRWFCKGRTATRAEVLESVESGLPALREMAAKDARPDDSLRELDRQVAAAQSLWPALEPAP